MPKQISSFVFLNWRYTEPSVYHSHIYQRLEGDAITNRLFNLTVSKHGNLRLIVVENIQNKGTRLTKLAKYPFIYSTVYSYFMI